MVKLPAKKKKRGFVSLWELTICQAGQSRTALNVRWWGVWQRVAEGDKDSSNFELEKKWECRNNLKYPVVYTSLRPCGPGNRIVKLRAEKEAFRVCSPASLWEPTTRLTGQTRATLNCEIVTMVWKALQSPGCQGSRPRAFRWKSQKGGMNNVACAVSLDSLLLCCNRRIVWFTAFVQQPKLSFRKESSTSRNDQGMTHKVA